MMIATVDQIVWVCCAVSFICTLLLAANAERLCRCLGLMDIPNERKHHQVETPLLGGIALLLTIFPIGIAVTSFLDSGAGEPSILVTCLTTVAIAVVGIIDDRSHLSPIIRLVAGFSIFGSAAAIDSNLLIETLSFPSIGLYIPLGSGFIAILVTSFCLVGLVNAVNMADGKNGLVLGLCLGWLILIANRAPYSDVPMLLVTLSGVSVLFIMNLFGKLFLGDGGAYGLAAFIGLLAIRSYNLSQDQPEFGLTAGAVALLFVVPVGDSVRLTIQRAAAGQSPMQPDRNHLHHILQRRFGWPGGLIVYLVAAMVPPAIVLSLY